jgi:hypothetical protein
MALARKYKLAVMGIVLPDLAAKHKVDRDTDLTIAAAGASLRDIHMFIKFLLQVIERE